MAEARDITLYLSPLLKHFVQFEDTDFSESKPLLKPLMHVVCLVWANSTYYRTSSKLIVLLRQICNLIIQQVRNNFYCSQPVVREKKTNLKCSKWTFGPYRGGQLSKILVDYFLTYSHCLPRNSLVFCWSGQ